MKTFKIFLLSMLLLIITTSCSNSSDDIDTPTSNSDFYVTFKAGGNTVNFSDVKNNQNVLGTFNLESDETNQYSSGITAVSLDGKNTMTILIGTLNEVQVNTVYTNYQASSPKVKAETYVSTYSSDTATTVFGSVNEEILLVIDGTIADSEIIFTEVNNTFISGRFSGTWYNFSDNNASLEITEGKFKVRRYGN